MVSAILFEIDQSLWLNILFPFNKQIQKHRYTSRFLFCKFDSTFILQRNVVLTSASDLVVSFFLAEIFEKIFLFFISLWGVFSNVFLLLPALIPLCINFITSYKFLDVIALFSKAFRVFFWIFCKFFLRQSFVVFAVMYLKFCCSFFFFHF